MRSLGLLLLLVGPWCKAQNLVPNGSFEDYTLCPDNPSQIERAVGWRQVQGSPEYFNVCATDPWASVPTNQVGYQHPYSGLAYAGVIVYSDSDWFDPPEFLREVIGIPLLTPLSPGTPVTVSFRVAPAVFGNVGVQWSANGIGAKFTMGPLALQPPQAATNDAVVQLATVLLDTAGWTLVTGTYVPDSAYDCLLIGNFISDTLLTTVEMDPLGTYGVAYTYVDEVCVSTTAGYCDLNNAIVEPSGSRIMAHADGEGYVSVIGLASGQLVDLLVYDPQGRVVASQLQASSQGGIRLDLRHQAFGVYSLVVQSAHGRQVCRFVLVQ